MYGDILHAKESCWHMAFSSLGVEWAVISSAQLGVTHGNSVAMRAHVY